MVTWKRSDFTPSVKHKSLWSLEERSMSLKIQHRCSGLLQVNASADDLDEA